MAEHFRLFLETNKATAPVIALLRRHTGKPLSELRNAVSNRQPFIDETPHHNQYSEFITCVTALLDDLEAAGISYLVEVDGASESAQYLRNVFQRWHDIGIETEHMSDLESGEPSIETLGWLKREPPADVFRQTIRQIIDGDGYACDEETVAWARRALEDAEPGAAADDGEM
ncbi:MAG: hypothetical protein KDA52_24745 [Planctomycetaceae bacterium]|nr:hypothetical protein [Planctomycetaceae bacterium]